MKYSQKEKIFQQHNYLLQKYNRIYKWSKSLISEEVSNKKKPPQTLLAQGQISKQELLLFMACVCPPW